MNQLLLTQIEWIRDLNGNSPQWLKAFFIGCNYIDTFAGYTIIAIVVWMGFKKVRGIELVVLALISHAITVLIKDYYQIPRPFVIDPSVGLVHVDGFSFPSGASQTAMLWGGYFIYHAKGHKFLQALAVLYILLISFSRIFLGVHYPMDVLMGWFTGGILVTLYVRYGLRAYNTAISWSSERRLLTFTIILLVIPLVFFNASLWRNFFTLFGIALGLYCDEKCRDPMKDPKQLSKRILRVLFSLIQVVALVLLLPMVLKAAPFSKLIFGFVVGFWVAFIMPRLNVRV
ncbi:MAG: phosphatase PAP2 family protein [Rhabdochlamydiaceae bacterium]|nr:phosphatase PAP2 family protein [Candidatus Amphrikana amoebophyrae]